MPWLVLHLWPLFWTWLYRLTFLCPEIWRCLLMGIEPGVLGGLLVQSVEGARFWGESPGALGSRIFGRAGMHWLRHCLPWWLDVAPDQDGWCWWCIHSRTHFFWVVDTGWILLTCFCCVHFWYGQCGLRAKSLKTGFIIVPIGAHWCPVVFSVPGLQPPLGETSQWTCREARLSTVLAPFWVEEIAVPVIKAEAGLGPETEIDFQVWFLKKCLRDLASWMDLNKDCEPEWWSPDYARGLTREEDEEEWYRNQQKGSMVCLLAMMWMVVISLTFQSSSYKSVSS